MVTMINIHAFLFLHEIDNLTKLELFIIMITYIYLGCNEGLYGPLCSKKCPYPSYGKGCQEICTCNNESCDNQLGCIGSYHYGLPQNSPFKHV